MPEQFIYALCDPGTTAPKYVGRSLDAVSRRRGHIDMRLADFTPKGLWIHYLQVKQQAPDSIVLEQASFGDDREALLWARDREAAWIRKLFADGAWLFNHGCWWKHPERKPIGNGTREAWWRLHQVYFGMTAGGGLDSHVARWAAFCGIRGLANDFPAIQVAPVEWLEIGEYEEPAVSSYG